MVETMGDVEATEQQVSNHILSDKWVLWAHLPHDTDWSLNSYIRIHSVNTVEDAIALVETNT